jgi:hypothetical protein
MAVVISRSHQAHRLLSSQHSQHSGTAKKMRSRRRTHTQDRAKDRALPTLTDTPGLACMVCIIHASSRAVLDVIAISSIGPPSDTRSACVLRGRVHLNGDCITTAILMRIAADLSYATTAVCGVLRCERPFL